MKSIEICHEDDIVRTRQAVRLFADHLGFSIVNKTRIATAVSELARNVYQHGGGGVMELGEAVNGAKEGIRCVFIDEGPGIPDIEKAIGDGSSTCDGRGQGLPGAKRLMDDMKIESGVGKGTRIEVVKWKQNGCSLAAKPTLDRSAEPLR